MKLLVCPQCSDIRGIVVGRWTICNCGESGARYDPWTYIIAEGEIKFPKAIVFGAKMIGFPNEQFKIAYQHNSVFPAWFYGDTVPDHGTIEYILKPTPEQITQDNLDAIEFEELAAEPGAPNYFERAHMFGG